MSKRNRSKEALLRKLGKAKMVKAKPAIPKPLTPAEWSFTDKAGTVSTIKIDARVGPSKKERAIAYIAASLAWRRAEIVRLEAHRELQLELMPRSDSGLAPRDAANYVDQQACIRRLEEVLEVLRSAP
jgi:hypothetical protein